MKVRLKHNEFRDLVNELRNTDDRYGGTDQLRDQLSHTLARRVRPVPEIVEMRSVLERIDARLAFDVLSASSTMEVLSLARDEIAALTEEVRGLRAAMQHEADCVEAASAEIEALRAKIAAMERQEPTAWVRGRDNHRRRKLSFEKPAKSSPDKFHWSPLYSLPDTALEAKP